eukprot:3558718-Amphidinium_carterae.1
MAQPTWDRLCSHHYFASPSGRPTKVESCCSSSSKNFPGNAEPIFYESLMRIVVLGGILTTSFSGVVLSLGCRE